MTNAVSRVFVTGLIAAVSLLAQDASYFRDVRPILQRNCQGCHQPAVKQGGLDLTRFATFAAGGSHGPVFKAGAPQESVILAFIKGDRQPRMPLGAAPLPDDQVELIRRWIAAGAKDDTPAEARETGHSISRRSTICRR